LFSIDLDQAMKASLVFIRVSFLIFMLPVFGEEVTPLRFKIYFSMALSFFLYTYLPFSFVAMHSPVSLVLFATLAIKEMLLGMSIGFTSRLLFEGLLMAANLVSYQMGFATVNIILPGQDLQSSSFTAMHKAILTIIFLGLSFHHVFIHAIVETFKVVPIGGGHLTGAFTQLTIHDTENIFKIAMQFASPILISLLFTTAALSLLARVFPQINIFSLSFPISFFVGLTIYITSIPLFPSWLDASYTEYLNSIFASIHWYVP